MDKEFSQLIKIENKNLSHVRDKSAILIFFPHIDDYFTIVGKQAGKESMQVYISKIDFLAMFAGVGKHISGNNFRRSNGSLLIVNDNRKTSISVSITECQEKLIECGLLRRDEVCIAS